MKSPLFAMLLLFASFAQAAPTELVLHDSESGFALYAGRGIRSDIPAESQVKSLRDLKSRLKKMPPGTHLLWVVSRDDAAGNPRLFKDGQFKDFEAFCKSRQIELTLSRASTVKASPAAVPVPDSPKVQTLKFKPADARGQILAPGEKAPPSTLEQSEKALQPSTTTR